MHTGTPALFVLQATNGGAGIDNDVRQVVYDNAVAGGGRTAWETMKQLYLTVSPL